MTEQKAPPTVEYSLKSVSWHLKTISDELIKLNGLLSQLVNNKSPF
jgi:hypothetical protein